MRNQTDAKIDRLLERYDQTAPQFQQRILVELIARLMVMEEDREALLAALRGVVTMIREETCKYWDTGQNHKTGQHLSALAGLLPGYRADTDALHALLARFTPE